RDHHNGRERRLLGDVQVARSKPPHILCAVGSVRPRSSSGRAGPDGKSHAHRAVRHARTFRTWKGNSMTPDLSAPAMDCDGEHKVFAELESEVQSYARSFPVVFDRAEGSWITDVDGRRYLDFLAGAGSLNYGHNNPLLAEKLVEYIRHGGITHSLDLHTVAKERFLEALRDVILTPRGL